MLRAVLYVIIFLSFGCKKNETKYCEEEYNLPEKLRQQYNSSTPCIESHCKPVLELVILRGQKYYRLVFDAGALCDLSTDTPNYYDSNGTLIDRLSDIYSQLLNNGKIINRIWQCCTTTPQ